MYDFDNRVSLMRTGEDVSSPLYHTKTVTVVLLVQCMLSQICPFSQIYFKHTR